MGEMKHYVIYNKPEDQPDKVVVREWIIGRNRLTMGKVIASCDTLEEARESIPRHLSCITRSEGDAPSIVETWI